MVGLGALCSWFDPSSDWLDQLEATEGAVDAPKKELFDDAVGSTRPLPIFTSGAFFAILVDIELLFAVIFGIKKSPESSFGGIPLLS